MPCSIGPATFVQTELRPFYDSSTMQWGSVYVDELRAKMRHVYEHRDEARVVGLRARDHILSKFNPENSAKMVEAAIRETPTIAASHSTREAAMPPESLPVPDWRENTEIRNVRALVEREELLKAYTTASDPPPPVRPRMPSRPRWL